MFVCKGVRGRKFGRGLPLDSQRRLFFKEVRLWWAAVWLSGIAGNMLLGTKILSLSHFFIKEYIFAGQQILCLQHKNPLLLTFG